MRACEGVAGRDGDLRGSCGGIGDGCGMPDALRCACDQNCFPGEFAALDEGVGLRVGFGGVV